MGKMFNKVNETAAPVVNTAAVPTPPAPGESCEVFSAATLYNQPVASTVADPANDGLVPGFVFYTGQKGVERPFMFMGERTKTGFPVLQCIDYKTLGLAVDRTPFPGTSGLIRQASQADVEAFINKPKKGGFKRRASSGGGTVAQTAPTLPAAPVSPAPAPALPAAPTFPAPAAPVLLAPLPSDEFAEYDQAVISMLALGERTGRFNSAMMHMALTNLGIR